MSQVFTIGHSTLALDQFIKFLKENNITLVIDVRSIPASTRNPQFNKSTLPAELAKKNIGYAHSEGLGGLRRAKKDSINLGWKNDSFRGYADYMQTDKFADALDTVIKMSMQDTVAIMCAEKLPWKCHRSLISDALSVKNLEVLHILDGKASPHKKTPWMSVDGEKIKYP